MEKVSGNHKFTAGPVWDKALGVLLFCDVPQNYILGYTPGKGTGKYRENTEGTQGNAIDAEGRLLCAAGRGRKLVRRVQENVEILAERFEGRRFNGPNDVTVRRDGHIYFSDPAFGAQADTREMDFHGIYHLTPKKELSLVAKWKTRPNGVTLSPNGRVLYAANSDERKVYAFDLDGRGKATGERVLIAKTEGVPDGLRSDAKGNLFVAAQHVFVFSPEGKALHTVFVAEKPSNVAFGDPDLMSLYITARTSVYRARMKVKGSVQD